MRDAPSDLRAAPPVAASDALPLDDDPGDDRHPHPIADDASWGATIVATPASSAANDASPLADDDGRSAISDLTSEGDGEARLAEDMAAILADLRPSDLVSAGWSEDDDADNERHAADGEDPAGRRYRPSRGGWSRNAAGAALLSGLVCGVVGLGVGMGLRQGRPAAEVAHDAPAASPRRRPQTDGRRAPPPPLVETSGPPPPPPLRVDARRDGAEDAVGEGPSRSKRPALAPGADADAAACGDGGKDASVEDGGSRKRSATDVAEARRQPKSPEEERRLRERYGALDVEERAFQILVDLGMVERHPDPDDLAWPEEDEDDDEDDEGQATWHL